MSADKKDGTTAVRVEEAVEAEADDRKVYLAGGRTLSVAGTSADLVEIRSSSGMLELRIKLTSEGPVLQMESVKLDLKAAESVSVDCKRFDVHASEGVDIKTEGHLELHSDKEMKIASPEDLRILGKIIYLN